VEISLAILFDLGKGAEGRHGGVMPSRPRLRRCLVLCLRFALVVALLGTAAFGGLWWYFHPESEVEEGIVYAQRHGRDLTLGVHRPKRASGVCVLVMVSGSWKSKPGTLPSWFVAPFLRQGQTVIAVSHLSQPHASVPETVEDVQRAVRYVRHHAERFGIDPRRLAATGGSSGGHLALMLATRGDRGTAEAPDPVDREDSTPQAVAVFFPVTDLIDLGDSTENDGTGGPPRNYKEAFGAEAVEPGHWARIGREVSPIFHVGPSLPPVLIFHGDADTLVPLDQSQRFLERAAESGREVELVVRRGAGHGWLLMLWDMRLFAKWIDRTLSG